jgi:hypothetical protein
LATGLKRRGTPMERIPASERTRERLKALMDGSGESAGGGSDRLYRDGNHLTVCATPGIAERRAEGPERSDPRCGHVVPGRG